MSGTLIVPRRWRDYLDVLSTVMIVVAAALVSRNALSSRPASTSQRRVSPPALAIPSAPISLEGAPVTGNPHARAVMLEFSDFECPFCGKFAREIYPAIEETYIKHGVLQVAFFHFPLPIHSHAPRAAQAAVCAGESGLFWQMHRELFAAPTALDDDSILRHGEAAGLNMESFRRCLRDPLPARVTQDVATGKTLGIRATPAFLFGTVQRDGRVKVATVLTGARPMSEFTSAVDALTPR